VLYELLQCAFLHEANGHLLEACCKMKASRTLQVLHGIETRSYGELLNDLITVGTQLNMESYLFIRNLIYRAYKPYSES
jgi:hypothetical protein